jgi:uncharacterized protein (TIGR02145 family)
MADTSTNCVTTVGYVAGQPATAQTGICPAPFRLPIGGAEATTANNANTTTSEFAKLDIAMGGTGQARDSANTYSLFTGTGAANTNWFGVLSGNYDGTLGGLYVQGINGNWWSSTTSNLFGVHHLGMVTSNTRINPASNSEKYNGFAVRCVL